MDAHALLLASLLAGAAPPAQTPQGSPPAPDGWPRTSQTAEAVYTVYQPQRA